MLQYVFSFLWIYLKILKETKTEQVDFEDEVVGAEEVEEEPTQEVVESDTQGIMPSTYIN